MPYVILKTNYGPIVLKLDAEKAPKTTQNFLNYVHSGHYSNTLLHRVIPGFMVQGGGLTQDMQNKPTSAPITNEANNGLKNEVGTIAMARTGEPHSATAQFFINVNNNTFLNHTSPTDNGWGYCVFGKVIDGMDVVNKIAAVKTGRRAGHQDVPEQDIIIESAEVMPLEQGVTSEATITAKH